MAQFGDILADLTVTAHYILIYTPPMETFSVNEKKMVHFVQCCIG